MTDQIIGTLIGALFILAGGSLIFRQVYRNKYWIKAMGTVINIREREVRGDHGLVTEFSGTFAYRLPRQSEILHFDDDVWQSRCRYQVAEEIEILINPNNPKEAWVKHGNTRIIVSALVVLAGGLLLYATFKH
jgi:hypothetical protein